MKSTHKIFITSSVPNLVADIAQALRKQGWEVNTDKCDWRVIMFRNKETAYSQGHTGLTSRRKVDRDYIRLSGPEVQAALSLLRKEHVII